MRRENNRILCEASEFAWIVASMIDLKSPSKTALPIFHFAVEVLAADGDDLETVDTNSTAWYGIHKVDTGFDSEDLYLVVDYYGGGCAPQFIHINNAMTREQIAVWLLMAMRTAVKGGGEQNGWESQILVRFDNAWKAPTEIIVEVHEGLVRNVYCTDATATVNVIDRDVTGDDMAEVDEALEEVNQRCNDRTLFNIW